MSTALEVARDELDEHEGRFVDAIRKFGWFHTCVGADEEGPTFSYTTGFWECSQHPELIMFGQDKDTSYGVFEDIHAEIQRGDSVQTGVPLKNVFIDAVAYAFPVAEKYYAEYLGWSRWFYRGNGFACIQIVWPDHAGKFPWDSDFDPEFKDEQPDVSELGWLNHLSNSG